MLRKIAETEKYDMLWWATCRDIEFAKVSGVRQGDHESDRSDRQQCFDDGGEGRGEYLERFRNKVVIRLVESFSGSELGVATVLETHKGRLFGYHRWMYG